MRWLGGCSQRTPHQRLGAPWIIDGDQPRPICLPPEDVGRFTAQRHLAPSWIGAAKTPPSQVQGQIADLKNLLNFRTQCRAHGDKARQRFAHLGLAASHLAGLRDEDRLGLIELPPLSPGHRH